MPYHTATERIIRGYLIFVYFTYFIYLYFFSLHFFYSQYKRVFSAIQLCEQYQLNYIEMQLRITGNVLVSINI